MERLGLGWPCSVTRSLGHSVTRSIDRTLTNQSRLSLIPEQQTSHQEASRLGRRAGRPGRRWRGRRGRQPGLTPCSGRFWGVPPQSKKNPTLVCLCSPSRLDFIQHQKKLQPSGEVSERKDSVCIGCEITGFTLNSSQPTQRRLVGVPDASWPTKRGPGPDSVNSAFVVRSGQSVVSCGTTRLPTSTYFRRHSLQSLERRPRRHIGFSLGSRSSISWSHHLCVTVNCT